MPFKKKLPKIVIFSKKLQKKTIFGFIFKWQVFGNF